MRAASRLVLIGALSLMLGAAPQLTLTALDRRFPGPMPTASSIAIYPLFVDGRTVPIRVTADWAKVPLVTTYDALTRDVTLWRWMHVDDWDTVPFPVRRHALHTMLARHAGLLDDPARWEQMDAGAWDWVPQPVRVVAFRRMIEYWVDYYQVGVAHALPREVITNTLTAIVMSECYFEHRAVNENPWGNRDLGVAQASDGARVRLAKMYDKGDVDFQIADEHYFNPWYGTRFVAVWMRMLLEQVDGDLDTAVRAYHRGKRRALRGEGEEYLDIVRRRLATLTGETQSRTWQLLRTWWETPRDQWLVERAKSPQPGDGARRPLATAGG